MPILFFCVCILLSKNRCQAIIWTNDDLIHLYMYESLSLNEFSYISTSVCCNNTIFAHYNHSDKRPVIRIKHINSCSWHSKIYGIYVYLISDELYRYGLLWISTGNSVNWSKCFNPIIKILKVTYKWYTYSPKQAMWPFCEAGLFSNLCNCH